ncbi:MAG: hypothetical protein QOK05_2784 [Chloroflexota bacterium]|jgi:hypothetical protein|nr:hypothetical protein [Chloroflexota bacterium]
MRLRVVLATLGIALIAACGGTTAKNTQTGGTKVSPTPSAGASLGTVNKAFWYAGFKVTVGQVSLKKAITPTPPAFITAPAKLLIQARFENLGPDNFQPYNEDLVLQSGANSYLNHDSQDEKIPDVPGLQATDGVIAFNVDEKFQLNNAVLLVGNARYNQGQVPLGKSGKYTSLEPQKVAISGTITVPDAFTLAVSGGDLSYDDPKNHQQQKAGDVMLIVHYAITGNRDSTCCFGSDNAILKLPDGTAIAATRASGYTLPGKGLTTADQFIEWVFKAASGAYDMIAKGKYGANNTDAQADLPFSIQVGVSATSSGTPPVGGSFPSPSDAGPQPTPSGH